MPRIIPACVIAGVVIVGDIDTLGDGRRRPAPSPSPGRSRAPSRAVGADLDVRGLEIAMDDALLVRRLERLRDLLAIGSASSIGMAPCGDAVGERRSFDELHHRAVVPSALRGRRSPRCWMIQRGEHLRFALEARESIGVGRDRGGQDLDRDLTLQLRVGARYTSPIPPSPIGPVIS